MTSGDLAVQKPTVAPWVASGLLTHQLKTPPNLSGFSATAALLQIRAPPWLLFAAQLGRRIPQRIQHLLLGRCCNLLLRQQVSALAIHYLDPQHEFAAKARDGSGDVGLTARPQA